MDRDATQIYCPNTSCQAPNAERNKFCQRCRTLLPKRYLWAIETGRDRAPLPRILDERYVLKGDRVYLDTHPGLLPHVPETVPDEIRAYLRLFPFRWNVPQIYGSAGWPSADGHAIWLLENAPIERRADGSWRPLDRISHAWDGADDLHRVGWLWQLAALWGACLHEGVASTLLAPQELRVEGSFVRLAQLVSDVGRPEPTFDKLGHVWRRWVPSTKSPLREFFSQLCDSIVDERLRTPEQVQRALDRARDRLQTTRDYSWQVATLSDRGPSRTRNEDACFPINDAAVPVGDRILGVVCDGVGGHEGGDIASSLAIETMAARVGDLEASHSSVLRPEKIDRVRAAIAEANDTIGKRNNSEQRQGRQRMGTTLVMGQGDRSDLFVSHIGDSRAYLVNRNAFYSLTVDDDVASREVRLGYAFYRAAVHQPTAGSLVQALGMSASSNLYPTIQRFILNEDSVILLCSDGLSDYDRVEQHWQSELQPLLDPATSLKGAAHRLIEIANTQNGHDNVTVALLRLQVKPNGKQVGAAELAECLQPLPEPLPETSDRDLSAELDTAIAPKRRSPISIALAICVPLALVAGFVALALLGRGGSQLAFDRADNAAADTEIEAASETPDADRATASAGATNPTAASPESPLTVGQQLALKDAVVLRQDKLDAAPALDAALAAGTIVEVKAIDKTTDRHWLQLSFCTPPAAAAPADTAIAPPAPPSPQSPTAEAEPAAIANGTESGWIELSNLDAAGYEAYAPPPGEVWSCE